MGPIGSVRLGRVDGKFIPFPTQDELEESDLDLIVSGNRDAVLMIEGFAREMPEDDMLEAIARRPRLHPADLRLADGAVRQGQGRKRRSIEVPAARRRCTTSSARKYYDDFKPAKQTVGQARPGRRRVGSSSSAPAPS